MLVAFVFAGNFSITVNAFHVKITFDGDGSLPTVVSGSEYQGSEQRPYEDGRRWLRGNSSKRRRPDVVYFLNGVVQSPMSHEMIQDQAALAACALMEKFSVIIWDGGRGDDADYEEVEKSAVAAVLRPFFIGADTRSRS